MATTRQSSLLALLAVVLGLLACDPGFYYRPEDWKKKQEYEWTQRFAGIELTTIGLSGFVGSTGIMPTFDVANLTDHTFVLQHAKLLVEENTYAANVARKEVKWRTVEPHSTRSLTINWEFDDVAVDALGERPIAVLEFTVGGDARRIEIQFTRAE